uniref:Myeloperoxidase-like protein n=1 Tax=Plecoglossus altivelis TaxID=61084 RepID=A0A6B7RCA8_PLEAT|nr:myeloperoxidase-like protein [Plecoglossus altivelis]
MNLLPSLLLTLGLALTLNNSVLSEESLGNPYIQSALEEAKRIVDDAYKYSREKSLARVRSESVKPSDVLRLYKQPRRDTRSAVRAADYMENTLRLIKANVHHAHKRSINQINATDILSDQDLKTIAKVTGCAARVRPPSCHTTPNINKYRTATSVCNNLKNPFFGASNTPFTRLLPAQYDDGISEPIGWDRNKRFNNFVLPLVREVSNLILNTTDEAVVSDQEFTHLVTLFGQWNDHDLTFTPFSPSIRSFSNGLDCDQSCERSEPCFPIPIPPRDPRIPPGPNNCIPVFRSAPVCGTGNTAYMFGGESNKREQINALTAFLDLGQVYGSEEQLALDLRNLTDDGGLMRVNTNFTDNGRELLPFSTLNGNMCSTRKRITNDTNAREVPCFFAGDSRVDENIALTSIHTLFVREHNRLARELRRINQHWDSETLYQEARKIQGAYAQILVFQDYLPHIVGPDVMNGQLGPYPGYNQNVDPRIANVFATAAYRFAHLAIQPLVFRVDQNLNENPRFPSLPLYEAFFTPWRVVFEGGVDPLLRGLIIRPAKLGTQDHMMVNALRDRLFQFVMHIALDLASLNMQRGRDHGLPGYNKWRRFCGLSEPQNLQELAQVLNNTELARRLLQLYGSPANIDVWLGGVAEPFVRNGRVGPLFACLIANQFKRIRQGDRLWYEKPGVFNSRQRASLKSVSLSRIICDNTGINMVPKDPFRIRSRSNPLVSCNTLQRLNLSPWRERDCETGSTGSCKNDFEKEIVYRDLLGPQVPQENEVLKA